MRGSRARRVGVVYGAGQVTALIIALWLNRHYQVGSTAALALVLVPTLPGAYLGWAAYRADRAEAALDVDVTARVLAAAVKASERDQVAQLLGQGGRRIDVLFEYVPQTANDAAGAAAQGQLADVLAYYRSLRPGRLVITGEPGAGKTLLALQLLLDILDDPARTDASPVPVRLSLASWDTHQPLTEWLAEQIHQRYANQGVTFPAAYTLVDQRRVLPVLDGLDEMDTPATPVGRRRAAAALARLNDYQDTTGSAPLVLTCRSQQHDELAAADVAMRDAARVRILPVTAVQADVYLTARTTDPIRWAPVLAALSNTPQGTLAQALDTPWRLNLASTVYEQRDPDTHTYVRDPADLLTLGSPSAVRAHLLARYVEAATTQHAGPYRSAQVHRWLARLATHLASPTGTAAAGTGAGTDLVLHQLWTLPGRRRVRTADALVTAFLALLLAALMLTQVPVGLSGYQVRGAGADILLMLFVVWAAASNATMAPQTVQLHRLRDPAERRLIARNTAAGLAGGLPVGLATGLAVTWTTEPAAGLATGIVTAALAPVLRLTIALTEPTDTWMRSGFTPPTNPQRPLRDDLTIGATIALTAALALFAIGEAAGGTAFGLMLPVAIAVGLGAGFYTAGRAGRRYLVFLLCCRGRLLPWRLGAFLHWSYDAGLLRVSGIAYQFRHRELQDWLAGNPTP